MNFIRKESHNDSLPAKKTRRDNNLREHMTNVSTAVAYTDKYVSEILKMPAPSRNTGIKTNRVSIMKFWNMGSMAMPMHRTILQTKRTKRVVELSETAGNRLRTSN